MSARRPYVRPMAGWWRRNPWFVEYMLHEATALAVAAYALACSLFGNDRVAGDPSIVGILADRSSPQIDRALLIEMWTATAYSDYRRTQGG